jgi:putative ABC transport system permease protein
VSLTPPRRSLVGPLARLALHLVPRHWRDSVRRDLFEESTSRSPTWRDAWSAWQIVCVAVRFGLRGPVATDLHAERRAGWLLGLGTLPRELRFAVRSLRRTPIFAATAAVVLSLGIGTSATVFTIVNTLLLRPLPFEGAEDIVQVRRRTPFGSSGSFPMNDYLALTGQRGALASLAILDVLNAGRYTLMTAGAAEPITACRVSAEFFDVFRVSPVRGRLFAVGDGVPGRSPAAVIAQSFWSGHFGSDPAVVGTSLTVGGQVYTVIGVAPDAVQAFSPAQVYLSLPVPAASTARTNSFQVVARIARGVTRAEAEGQVDTIARRHANASPSLTNMPQGVVLQSLQEEIVAPIRPALEALMVAVALVLLIACSNVANLVLTRGLARRWETAVMAALGASGWRIAQRIVAENILVAIVGGGAGLVLAYAGVRALPVLSGADLPQADRIHIDGYVLLYVTATTALAALAASLPSALQFGGHNLGRSMKEGDARGGSGAAGHRVRLGLTASQIALSTILLAGAGLLTRSFWNLTSVDPGFQSDGLLTMSVSLTPARYPDSARLGAYTDAVSLSLERIPGVVAASSTTALPSEFPIDFPVSPVGASDLGARTGRSTDLDAWYRAVNPHFFSAMRIPVVKGRSLLDSDSSAGDQVIVINQALAHAAFPSGDAVGQALIIGRGYLTDARDLRPRTIVGVVGDTREQGLRFAPTPTMYVPVAQAPELITQLVVEKIPVRWVIRTDREPTDLVAAVRHAVLAVDRTQPATDFAKMTDILGRSISSTRFNMLMLAIFSGLALVLAAIGVYGLTAHAVAQRTREIGIRMSLGATPRQLVRGLVEQGLRLCLFGSAIGLVGAIVLGRFLRSLLFGVSATDGLTILVVVGGMAAVVVAATYLPASRASRIDPVLALRQD